MAIGFIGAGQMAKALAQGFCHAGLVSGSDIWASDVVLAACESFRSAVPDSHICQKNAEVLAHSEVVFLAVKPQHLADAAAGLGGAGSVTAGAKSTPGPLFVSIAAGVPLTALCAWLHSDRVIRVMPNTPCLVSAGASAYCVGSGVTAADEMRVVNLLEAVGTVARVSELLMDAVTGLSGSGPAYVFLVIEAMADAGVLQGIPRTTALQLAAQTVLGSARMVLETNVHPAELRDRVTSPGGTTAHGLQALEDRGVRGAFLAAVQMATQRSRDLGK